MKLVIFLLSAAILITLIFLILIPKPIFNQNSYVMIDGKKFSVDVAKTESEQSAGLSIYNKLPIDKGMIFPFDNPGYYGFWMKDMKFPIDIIYIRKNMIVDIFENVLPPKSQDDSLPIFKPKSQADIVLEINSGLTSKYKFKIGDIVKINY